MRQRQRGQAFITFIGSSPLVEKMNVFFKNVIPAEAGIQRYLNVISYVFVFTGFPPTREQVPACAGTGLDSRYPLPATRCPPARAQVSGFLATREKAWIPASAGMTKRSVDDSLII